MGRYSGPLAPPLADFAGVQPGQRVLDVGCGPGALTAELVARGGVVAASTWAFGGEMRMLRTFWDAALSLDPTVPDEARVLRYTDADSLWQLWRRTGLGDVVTTELLVAVDYDGYDDFWQPFFTGTGPAGAYCVSLDDPHRQALRDAIFQRLGAPAGSFALTARAWAVRGPVSHE